MNAKSGLLVVIDPTGQLAERLRELFTHLEGALPANAVGTETLAPALRRGAADFVALGSVDDLRRPVPGEVHPDVVHGNGHGRTPSERLTRRELEVLHAVARGRSNAGIARDLFISQDTVRFHLRNAYRKLGVHDRVEAGRIAADQDPAGADL